MTPEDKTPTLTFTSTLHFHKIICNMYFVNYTIILNYNPRANKQTKILTFVIRNSVRSMKVASPSLEDWLFPASFGELPFDEDLFEDGRKRE